MSLDILALRSDWSLSSCKELRGRCRATPGPPMASARKPEASLRAPIAQPKEALSAGHDGDPQAVNRTISLRRRAPAGQCRDHGGMSELAPRLVVTGPIGHVVRRADRLLEIDRRAEEPVEDAAKRHQKLNPVFGNIRDFMRPARTCLIRLASPEVSPGP